MPYEELTSLNAIIVLVISIILAILAYKKGVLDTQGSILAFIVGAVIGIFGSIYWLILLLIFMFSSFGATRFKFALKKAKGVSEGERGRRGAKNVLGNGLVPMIIAILAFCKLIDNEEIIFISAVCVAASDTLASEIGVLSDKVYLITNLKRVKPGTDGGISVLGQLSALFGAMFVSLIGWIILPEVHNSGMDRTAFTLLLPIFIGFLGCQIDSILGATLENRYLFSLGQNYNKYFKDDVPVDSKLKKEFWENKHKLSKKAIMKKQMKNWLIFDDEKTYRISITDRELNIYEQKGILNKEGVNFISIGFGVLLTWLILGWF